MAKVTIYLPDRMHRQVVGQKLPISKICQVALTEALDARHLSTGARIRRVSAQLEAISDDADTRILTAIQRVADAGIDPEQIFGDLPKPLLLRSRYNRNRGSAD